MAIVKSRAITLKSYRLGETSKVVVCYTRNFGKVRLVAKGARKGGGRFGAALEPMVVSGVVFYHRPGGELELLSQAEVERQWPVLRRDVVRMAYAGAVLELTDALVSEAERDERLFDTIEGALEAVAAAETAALDPVLWSYEISLSRALGYGPEIEQCVSCGKEVLDEASFSPTLGGLLCAGCAGRTPSARGLSGEARAVVARLPLGLGEGADSVSDVSDLPAMSTAVRDEIGEVLISFLSEHAGRELRLKSLGFLAQVRRTGRCGVESERENDG
jgi:DNA repair protein RecO (recombination protein O)